MRPLLLFCLSWCLLTRQSNSFLIASSGRQAKLHGSKSCRYPTLPVLLPSISTPSFSQRLQQDTARRQVADLVVLQGRRKTSELLDNDSPPSRRRSRFRKFLQTWKRRFFSLILVLTLVFGFVGTPAAYAQSTMTAANKPAVERNAATFSIRPGMTRTQAELLERGEVDVQELEASSVFANDDDSSSNESLEQQKDTASKKKTFDYGEEDDEDYSDDDDLVHDKTSARRTMGSSSFTGAEEAIQQQRSRPQFAAQHKTATLGLKLKVAVAFFIPTYGILIVREFFRRKKEAAYLKKGLEIFEVQKAEYFNVTATSTDTDVEDALKKIKNNETDTDDEDDDEDDDDEDDDDEDGDDDDDDEDVPPPPSSTKKGPRRPSGGGSTPSSGGPSSSGGSSGGGSKSSGKPSDEDIAKLNKLYGRS